MGREYEASSVSMRDVWQALSACREDHGVNVRVVAYLSLQETAPGVVCFVAQPCGATGPDSSPDLVARQAWPTNRFRTLAALLHWLVWDVYQRVDAARERAAQGEVAASP